MTRYVQAGAAYAPVSFTAPAQRASAPAPAPGLRAAEEPPEPEAPCTLSPEHRRILTRTPLDRWHMLAVLYDETVATSHVMTRSGLASWLDAHDLGGLAHEARVRRVARGSILTLTISEAADPRWRVLFGDDDPPRRKDPTR